MAINTAAKRASVQAYATGLMRPPPDGTIAEGDRACVAWLYQGLDYAIPVGGGHGGPNWLVWFWDFFFGFEDYI